MFFVFRIGQDRQVFFIPGHSPDIFRGSAAFAVDARRILRICLRQKDGFQNQVMLPAMGYGNDSRQTGPYRRKWFIMCSIRFLLGWERAIRTKFGLQRDIENNCRLKMFGAT